MEHPNSQVKGLQFGVGEEARCPRRCQNPAGESGGLTDRASSAENQCCWGHAGFDRAWSCLIWTRHSGQERNQRGWHIVGCSFRLAARHLSMNPGCVPLRNKIDGIFCWPLLQTDLHGESFTAGRWIWPLLDEVTTHGDWWMTCSADLQVYPWKVVSSQVNRVDYVEIPQENLLLAQWGGVAPPCS